MIRLRRNRLVQIYVFSTVIPNARDIKNTSATVDVQFSPGLFLPFFDWAGQKKLLPVQDKRNP